MDDTSSGKMEHGQLQSETWQQKTLATEAAQKDLKAHTAFSTVIAAGPSGPGTPPSGGPQTATTIMPGSETGSLEGCDQGPCSGPGCCGGGEGSRGYGLGEEQ